MIQIPAYLAYLAILAALGLIGSGITAVYRLGVRCKALEERETVTRINLMRLEGILYRMNPNAFKSDK